MAAGDCSRCYSEGCTYTEAYPLCVPAMFCCVPAMFCCVVEFREDTEFKKFMKTKLARELSITKLLFLVMSIRA